MKKKFLISVFALSVFTLGICYLTGILSNLNKENYQLLKAESNELIQQLVLND